VKKPLKLLVVAFAVSVLATGVFVLDVLRFSCAPLALGGSSEIVAAHWRDEFLIGALMEPKVLICKTNP
jgi:hypothetical protein